jgi:hypothetical protein
MSGSDVPFYDVALITVRYAMEQGLLTAVTYVMKTVAGVLYVK